MPATTPPPVEPPSNPQPRGMPIQETVVIPTTPPQTPNIYQTPVTPPAETPSFQPVSPDMGIPASSQKSSKPGGGFGKILKTLLMLLLLALLIGGGIYAATKFMGGSKTATISYWGLWENENIITPLIADFESTHPNIKVEYVKQSHKEYRERLSSAIERGEGPDVFRFHNTWVPMYKSILSTVPEDIMTVSEFSSTFYPVAKRDLVGGSNIYGMPVMIDGLGLYVNTDLLAAAGASPPTSWEDVLTMVPRLTVRNGESITTAGIALGTANNVEHFSDILATMIMQNGGDLVNPTSKESEEALIFYRKFADLNDPVYSWNSTMDNSVYAFATGKVAMIFAPSWRAFDVKQINPNFNWIITPIPQLPGNTVTWASYWVEGVSAKSPNQKAAWEFVKYMTGKEGATKLYTEASKVRLFGEPYARVDMAGSLAGDAYTEAYVKQAPDARSFPLASRTFDNGLNDQMIKYLEDAVNSVAGGSAPSAALKTASYGFQQILSKYGLVSASAPLTQ